MRIDSRSRLRRTLLLCGLLVLVPGVARAWRSSLPGVGMARAVAVEADGRVVAAGEIAGTGETLFSVALFDALAGTSIWRKDVAVGEATGIALDAAGDILASGFIGSKDGAGIVKLDDLTGNESWRFRVPRSVIFPGRSVAEPADAERAAEPRAGRVRGGLSCRCGSGRARGASRPAGSGAWETEVGLAGW